MSSGLRTPLVDRKLARVEREIARLLRRPFRYDEADRLTYLYGQRDALKAVR